jgi:tetratricopeptide (TPR) repeat protein
MILAAVMAMRNVGSSDAGFHLKVGAHILDHWTWPRTDEFTYTLRDRPYIDTSWGYQVLIAAVERAFSARGLVTFHAAMILTTFALILLTARLFQPDATWLALLMALGVLSSEMRFEVRPEVLSWLMLATMIYLLTRHAEGRRSPLWAIPLLQFLWANCHALFLLGWLTMAGFIVGLALRDRRFDRRLLLMCSLAVAACFLNPYGPTGVWFPISLLTRFDRSNAFSVSIGEFVSPFDLRLTEQQPFFPVWPIYSFRLFALICLLGLWAMIRHRRYWGICLFLVTMPLAAKMQRNMPLVVIAMLPLAATAFRCDRLMHLFKLRERSMRFARHAILSVLLLIVIALTLRVVHDAYYIDGRRTQRFGWDWGRLDLPVDAAAYAKQVGLSGPMLNHLNLGGYLMWALPDPVFIDGRLEVVGEEFYARYLGIMGSKENLDEATARYQFNYIAFPYAISQRLLIRLSSDTNWRLAYFDHYVAIFVRNSPDSERFVDKRLAQSEQASPIDLKSLPGLNDQSRPGPLRRWLAGCSEHHAFPSDDEFRGLFHLFRGEHEAAERRFATAIKKSDGRYHEIYQNLAAALVRQGKNAEAAACYRIVLEEDPENRVARRRLAEIGRQSTGGR